MKSPRLIQFLSVLSHVYVRAEPVRDRDNFSGDGTDDSILPKSSFFQKLVHNAKELGRAQIHVSPNSTSDSPLDNEEQANEPIPIASPIPATEFCHKFSDNRHFFKIR